MLLTLQQLHLSMIEILHSGTLHQQHLRVIEICRSGTLHQQHLRVIEIWYLMRITIIRYFMTCVWGGMFDLSYVPLITKPK